MTLFPLLSFALRFGLVAVRTFVARTIINRRTSGKRLFIYAVLAAAVHYALKPWPFLVPKILFETTAYLALQARVFEAPLFPDAAVVVSLPYILYYSGHLILPPLISCLLETPISLATTHFLSFIPSLSLTICFLVRKMMGYQNVVSRKTPDPIAPRIMIITGAGFILQLIALLNLVEEIHIASRAASIVYMTVAMMLTPVVGIALFVQLRQTNLERKRGEYHALKHRVQNSAMQALREERHEYLNKLALISSYLQLGKLHKAQFCIDYAAASLSQEQVYATLPQDAWLTILETKKQTAAQCGVDFTIDIKAEPPLNYTEQRLLPKLISNLVDNAFEAAASAPMPQVKLLWEQRGKTRVLQVSNNGPPISCLDGRRIFQPGVTTKNNSDESHGWGLVICRKIAGELQGTLSYASDENKTIFTLTLPAAPSGEERADPHL